MVVLKGPVLARWLYPGEVRPYVDCDLMVAPENRARAVSVLERLGFMEHLPWMPVPLSLDPGGTAFNRPGEGMVDLHCQLPGLDGDPDAIWSRLAANAKRQMIAGVELLVPDRDMVLLHVVLHAAHHANQVDGKPLEDLRRALALVEEAGWSSALELARAYRGVPAFAAGLRLLPEGEDLARRLDLGGRSSARDPARGQRDRRGAYALGGSGASWRLRPATSFPDPTTCGGGHRWPGVASSAWPAPTSGAQSGLSARPQGRSTRCGASSERKPGREPRRTAR